MKFNIWKGKRKRKVKSNTTDNKDVVQVKKKTKTSKDVEKNENNIVQIATEQNLSETPNYKSITKIYSLGSVNVYAGLASNKGKEGGMKYVLMEPPMEPKVREVFNLIRKMLITELRVDLGSIKTSEDAEEKLRTKIQSLIETYNLKISQKSLNIIQYYAVRDFVHLGKIEPILHDHMIEEISCDGTDIPIYLWHREYESIPTNIIFKTDEELENFTRKLAYATGKNVSLANPIVDSSLPDGSRINMTFGREITKRGCTFTIRKFKADPITVVDLVKFNTMSSESAAFLWYAVEKRMTMLVAGGTASGKTTTLNTLASFIVPGQKIVTIEDTAELNVPHDNWISSVSRESFAGSGGGDITQFDLLRAALRQRPDFIIVGETRGKEAFTLFQAMATGHGGFSSIHSDSVEATLTRLTSDPMNIGKDLIANTLDIVLMQLKIKHKGQSVRRMMQITELAGVDKKSGEIIYNDVFKWDPETDTHQMTGKSLILEKISTDIGEPLEQIALEIKKRKHVIEWMIHNDIRNHKDVSSTIMEFYSDPDKFYERKRILVNTGRL